MSMVDISSTERRIAERVDPGIANQIVVSNQAGGIAFRDAGEMMEFAKMMAVANSGVRKHLRGNVGACLAILTQANEWGLSPFQVANKSYFVNDQIAFESQLVQAVILKRAPIRGRIKFEYSGEGQGRVCRAWARLREDDEVVDYTSPAIKDIKVKNSPLWIGDPDQQLAYFAGRSLCRRHFPDVLLGIYTDDEIEREAPAVGPDRARDVTPPRSIGAKLDALAAKPTAVAQQPATVEHDPETGEVRADAFVSEDDAISSGEPGSDEGGPEDPHTALMAELREKVFDGASVHTLLNALGDRRPLVSEEDKKGLNALAKDVAEKRKAAAQVSA